MRRLLFFSFLILSSFQCFPTVDYDGSQRIQVSGKMIDKDGKPLSGVPYILVPIVGFKEEGGVDIASRGVSDDKGAFNFMISDNNAQIYKLLINRQFALLGFNNFQTNTIKSLASLTVDIDAAFIKTFELELGTIIIEQGTQLSLTCNPDVAEKISYVEIYTSDTLTIGKPSFDKKRELYLDSYRQVCRTQADVLSVSKNSRVLLTYFKENEFINDTISIGQEPVAYVFK